VSIVRFSKFVIFDQVHISQYFTVCLQDNIKDEGKGGASASMGTPNMTDATALPPAQLSDNFSFAPFVRSPLVTPITTQPPARPSDGFSFAYGSHFTFRTPSDGFDFTLAGRTLRGTPSATPPPVQRIRVSSSAPETHSSSASLFDDATSNPDPVSPMQESPPPMHLRQPPPAYETVMSQLNSHPQVATIHRQNQYDDLPESQGSVPIALPWKPLSTMRTNNPTTIDSSVPVLPPQQSTQPTTNQSQAGDQAARIDDSPEVLPSAESTPSAEPRQFDERGGGVDGVRGEADGVRGGADGVRAGADGIRGGADWVRAGADWVREGADWVRGAVDGVRERVDGVRGGADGVSRGADGVRGGADGVRGPLTVRNTTLV